MAMAFFHNHSCFRTAFCPEGLVCSIQSTCGTIRGITPTLIAPRSSHTERKTLAVILCIAGLLAVSSAVGSKLTGQVVEGDCWSAEKLRKVPCDEVDKTKQGQAEKKVIPPELQRRIDRNKTITPEEEQRVEEFLEKRYEAPRLKKVSLLQTMVDTSRLRLDALLTLAWKPSDSTALARLQQKFNKHAAALEATHFSKAALSQLRDSVHRDVLTLQGFATRKPPSDTAPQPIEHIVTKIDRIVAQVGTVIGEIEGDGVLVPASVHKGYEQAKDSVRAAKRSCSMRRPQACTKLWDVLRAIESIREPLCALPSERLTFCRT